MLTFWEYRVVHGGLNDGSVGERTLNEYGMEGWELVAETAIVPNDGRYSDRRWVFKRPKATTRQAQALDRSKLYPHSDEVLKDKGF